MKFNTEINISTVIAAISVIGVGMAGWAANKERIQHVETEVVSLKESDKEIKSQVIKTEVDIIKRLDDIKSDVRDVKAEIRDARGRK